MFANRETWFLVWVGMQTAYSAHVVISLKICSMQPLHLTAEVVEECRNVADDFMWCDLTMTSCVFFSGLVKHVQTRESNSRWVILSNWMWVIECHKQYYAKQIRIDPRQDWSLNPIIEAPGLLNLGKEVIVEEWNVHGSPGGEIEPSQDTQDIYRPWSEPRTQNLPKTLNLPIEVFANMINSKRKIAPCT